MEVHPPHGAMKSLKEVLQELLIVTAGILIALSLDGLLAWKHHHDLAREARSNIISEIRENQRELSTEIEQLQKMTQQVQNIINLVHQLETNRKTPIRPFEYGFSVAELHSTSWNSASTTGALSYMPYSEVKKYTELYDLQHAFDALQERSFAASLDVQGMATLLQRNPSTITSAELSDAERRLGISMANVVAMRQIAQPLSQRYSEVLKSVSDGQ